MWNNDAVVNGKKASILKATIDRRYKDKDGTWKSSGSFSRNEIPLAVFCLLKAFAAMVGEEVKRSEVLLGGAAVGLQAPPSSFSSVRT